MSDARFEEGAERPLRLKAETAEDLGVVSALIQDAVGQIEDTAWLPGRRRFAMLISRFRWEDKDAAERTGRGFERVRSILSIEQVASVRANGIDPTEKDLVFSLLSLMFEPDPVASDGSGSGPENETEEARNPGGKLRVVLAGDGEIVLDVEAIDIALRDVNRPHLARSRQAPGHGD